MGDGNFINGDITEQGPGDVVVAVRAGGLFNGNIREKGAGELTTRGNGFLNGSTLAESSGKCRNEIAGFNGDACE